MCVHLACMCCDHVLVGVPPILLIPSASAELELLSLHHAQEVAIATPRAAPSATSACDVGSHAIHDHSTVVLHFQNAREC